MSSPRKPVTKKLINTPETCVDDNLRGIVAMYSKLHLHPKHRVVTLQMKSDSGRVAILGGGGSGHEPFAAGLVGNGMLDGAVAGGVFASPPTGNVLYAISQLYKYNKGGVIVIIGNYTGDRLNFGKAIEKAKVAGIKVEGVIVGEDVASSHNKTGGRSMCGEVFFYKLCAGMALVGYDLSTIRDQAIEVNRNMATLGVCLSACSLPGQPPLFEISSDEMELGAGVHGEAGIKKLKMGTAKEVVSMILEKVTKQLNITSGERVAVMINNLGGTSVMEMNILSAETRDYLENHHIKVERIYTGHLKTSLEMHGFQICLLRLTKDNGDLWLKFLDIPTEAGGWVGCPLSAGKAVVEDDETLLRNTRRKAALGPKLGVKQQSLLKGALLKASEELINNEELLNRLDSGCGDGDCGNTLKKFAEAIQTYLQTASVEYPCDLLWDLSEMAETDMGGTSGGIYSLGLAAASQAVADLTSLSPTNWLKAWKSSMEAITKYGGAEPGDRTMLDTLNAAAIQFEENLQKDLGTLLKMTAEASEQGTKDTVNMVANAGRASYVSSVYLKDEDAGARAAAIWIQAILSYVAENY